MLTGRRLAPAKINLTLEVLAKKPDGFHALRSVVVPVDLGDELLWRSSSTFAFTCSLPELENEQNLALRAARAIGIDKEPLGLHLEKRIPFGAGLGGGSSDAAAVLLAALAGEFGTQAGHDWLQIARSLGSDVPLFLTEAPVLLEGTGERVTALGAAPPWWAVIVHPGVSMSTSDAYRAIDERRGNAAVGSRAASISLRMVEALQAHAFDEVVALLQNDFTTTVGAALPQVAHALEVMKRTGSAPTMTGSGSALFSLFERGDAARAFADRLRCDPALPNATHTIFCVRFVDSARFRHETSHSERRTA